MGIVTFTFLFVMAVSIDSFGIGCVFGMKNIRLSFTSVVLIALLSGSCFLISSYLGHLLVPLVPIEYADRMGACALIGIGAFFLWQYFRKPSDKSPENQTWLQPTRVLSDPQSADVDNSGGIKGKEVWLLGIALSLDTIGAGMSGAFIGVSPLLTASLISLATCLMLFGGLVCGTKLSEKVESISILPGVLLIIIGIIKLT